VLPRAGQEVFADDPDRVEVARGGDLVRARLRGARQVRGERDRRAAGVGAQAVDLREELAAERLEPRVVRCLGS
jgi:hypothetical protein